MKGTRITKEIKEKVLELFKQGLGYRSVSKMLGLNEGTVKGYSQLYRSGDEITWVDNEHKRSAPDPKVLLDAVREYLEGRYGYRYLSIKYGLRDSTIKKAVKNYQTHGIVTLSKGRPTMETLRAQKAQLQQRKQQQDEKPLSKKDHKELLDLLEVNIALLEVLEECDPDEVKKKDYRQQIKQLQAQLAYERRVAS